MPEVDTQINKRDQARMVWVPPGPFLMGDDLRSVEVPGYWIYKYPVTEEQYKRFCTETGAKPPKAPSWGWHADHPVVNVSWKDASAYCHWAGVDLPTEAEWEKAARGTDGRRYPWGDKWDPDRCQCSGKSWCDAERTSPVTAHPSGTSPYGAFDMSGNVGELCKDWYDEAEQVHRVVRGGAWYGNVPGGSRCAARNRIRPGASDYNLGFRCVLRPGSTNPSAFLTLPRQSRNLPGESKQQQHVAARRLSVFLCHSIADKPAVRGLYDRLRPDGFAPWLDEVDLLPGQVWEDVIKRAVRDADVVVVCLSPGSLTKSGFVNKEIKFALDQADEKPPDLIYIIPLKLEECEVPERLHRWHWVNHFEAGGYERLKRALSVRAGG